MDLAKIYEKQNKIIKEQSDIIDDLFLQLLQYVTIEEEEKEIEMIGRTAKEQKEVLE